MSLDDVHLSQRELLLRDRERDQADAKAAYEEQRLIESVEAREGHWVGVMRAMPAWVKATHWSGT